MAQAIAKAHKPLYILDAGDFGRVVGRVAGDAWGAFEKNKKNFISRLHGESDCGKLSAFLTTEGLSDCMSRPRKLGITKVGSEVERGTRLTAL